MDHKQAFDLLEINFGETRYEELTTAFLKKQYRKMALRHHPDKNGNTSESNERFQQINAAYEFLRKELQEEQENKEEDEIKEEPDTNFLYWNILKNFVRGVLESNDTAETVVKIVKEIFLMGKQISEQLFEGLDKQSVLNVYSFLSTYKSTLHFSNELLDKIRQLVLNKYDSVEIYKLNPSINDLMENNLYKLYIEEELFLVPLWHSENYFDSSLYDKEIIVICEPELPPSISIDDDNNLFIEAELYGSELLHQILYGGSLCVNIGSKTLSIPLSNLYMKQQQIFRFKKEGIAKVKKDIYDVGDRSDIIVNITIV